MVGACYTSDMGFVIVAVELRYLDDECKPERHFSYHISNYLKDIIES